MNRSFLSQLKDRGQFLSLYINHEASEKFIFGNLLTVGKDFFIFESIAPDGRHDGLLLDRVGLIFRAELESRYHSKMMKLMAKHGTQGGTYDFDEENPVLSLLKFAKERNYVISIELIDSGIYDVIGLLLSCEDEICEIRQLDEYGQEDGRSIIQIADISSISCNSQNERDYLC